MATTLAPLVWEFNRPLGSDAVVTADHHTSVIAKDVNHVFDFSVTFNYGEYTG